MLDRIGKMWTVTRMLFSLFWLSRIYWWDKKNFTIEIGFGMEPEYEQRQIIEALQQRILELEAEDTHKAVSSGNSYHVGGPKN